MDVHTCACENFSMQLCFSSHRLMSRRHCCHNCGQHLADLHMRLCVHIASLCSCVSKAYIYIYIYNYTGVDLKIVSTGYLLGEHLRTRDARTGDPSSGDPRTGVTRTGGTRTGLMGSHPRWALKIMSGGAPHRNSQRNSS